MKHRDSGTLKVLKQLRKAPDIVEIQKIGNGKRIVTADGLMRVIHFSPKCYKPLAAWLRKHTSIQQLKY